MALVSQPHEASSSSSDHDLILQDQEVLDQNTTNHDDHEIHDSESSDHNPIFPPSKVVSKFLDFLVEMRSARTEDEICYEELMKEIRNPKVPETWVLQMQQQSQCQQQSESSLMIMPLDDLEASRKNLIEKPLPSLLPDFDIALSFRNLQSDYPQYFKPPLLFGKRSEERWSQLVTKIQRTYRRYRKRRKLIRRLQNIIIGSRSVGNHMHNNNENVNLNDNAKNVIDNLSQIMSLNGGCQCAFRRLRFARAQSVIEKEIVRSKLLIYRFNYSIIPMANQIQYQFQCNNQSSRLKSQSTSITRQHTLLRRLFFGWFGQAALRAQLRRRCREALKERIIIISSNSTSSRYHNLRFSYSYYNFDRDGKHGIADRANRWRLLDRGFRALLWLGLRRMQKGNKNIVKRMQQQQTQQIQIGDCLMLTARSTSSSASSSYYGSGGRSLLMDQTYYNKSYYNQKEQFHSFLDQDCTTISELTNSQLQQGPESPNVLVNETPGPSTSSLLNSTVNFMMSSFSNCNNSIIGSAQLSTKSKYSESSRKNNNVIKKHLHQNQIFNPNTRISPGLNSNSNRNIQNQNQNQQYPSFQIQNGNATAPQNHDISQSFSDSMSSTSNDDPSIGHQYQANATDETLDTFPSTANCSTIQTESQSQTNLSNSCMTNSYCTSNLNFNDWNSMASMNRSDIPSFHSARSTKSRTTRVNKMNDSVLDDSSVCSDFSMPSDVEISLNRPKIQGSRLNKIEKRKIINTPQIEKQVMKNSQSESDIKTDSKVTVSINKSDSESESAPATTKIKFKAVALPGLKKLQQLREQKRNIGIGGR